MQMQVKHWPVGRTSGEGDLAGLDKGVWSHAGANRSMRNGGEANS